MTTEERIMELSVKGLVKDLFLKAYLALTDISRKGNQIVGEKHDYYVTLEQLEAVLMSFN